MDAGSIIPNLLDTATKIFVLILDYHRDAVLKKNLAAADLLQGIGDTLSQVADSLEQDQYPANCCGRLREYALLMPQVLTGCIEDHNVDRYTAMLLENYQIEMVMSYFHRVTSSERENQLDQLRSAAGAFQVASEIVRGQ